MIGFFASDISVGEAALRALIGFIIVLAVLALLVGIFYLSGFLFSSKAFNRKGKNSKEKAQAGALPSPDEDEEIVAVITAAIAAMLESEYQDEKPDFVIRRITRK